MRGAAAIAKRAAPLYSFCLFTGETSPIAHCKAFLVWQYPRCGDSVPLAIGEVFNRLCGVAGSVVPVPTYVVQQQSFLVIRVSDDSVYYVLLCVGSLAMPCSCFTLPQGLFASHFGFFFPFRGADFSFPVIWPHRKLARLPRTGRCLGSACPGVHALGGKWYLRLQFGRACISAVLASDLPNGCSAIAERSAPLVGAVLPG